MAHDYVFDYSAEALARTLAAAAYEGSLPSESDIAQLAKLPPVMYLHGYLCAYCREEAFEAKTIVVEREYIDRDYLTEYAGYYSTSFQPVHKKTTRLHFFSRKFSQQKFESWLLDATPKARAEVQEHYLGFVVVRPMHTNFMGRTCLKHYPAEKTGRSLLTETPDETKKNITDTRHYTVGREYAIDLFGMSLRVRSVAFQEQDSVVGMCASAAMYALLHGIKPVFDTKTYSALEITKMASGYAMPSNLTVPSMRALPNTGLTFSQMFQALEEFGLSPTLVSVGGDVHHQTDAVATLYAYLSAGLPVLAQIALVSEDTLPEGGEAPEKDWKDTRHAIHSAEKHAFTIVGYSMATKPQDPLPAIGDQPRLQEVARRVNKFYVHCDRIGPFAKFWRERRSGWLTLRPDALKQPTKKADGAPEMPELAYSGIGQGRHTYAVPIVFIVPTNEKLRLGFVDAYEVAQAVHSNRPGIEAVWTWDIKVCDVRALRKAWLDSKGMDAGQKLRALKEQLPRFCWRVIATLEDGTPMFEVVLDCTATSAEESVLMVVAHSGKIDALLSMLVDQLRVNLGDHSQRKDTQVRREVMQRLVGALKPWDAGAAGAPQAA